MARPATLIAGDGIGPEIVDSVIQVADALGSPFSWDRQAMGKQAFDACGEALPAATLDSLRRNGLGLKGPIETPLVSGFRSPLVQARTELQLYANIRPGQSLMPGGRYEGIDIILFRENTEGLYCGTETYVPHHEDPQGKAQITCWNTREGCRRIIDYGFEWAIRHGRRKVTVVHKANVLKAFSGIFLDTARQRYREHYADRIAMDEMIVDACAMQLVMDPWQFDVIVTTNLFGDILSDQIAGLTGGLGLAPAANIGPQTALFEAVHGSAPEIAGRGIANPTAILRALGMMLAHSGLEAQSRALERCLRDVIVVDQVKTPDLGGTADTATFTRRVITRLARYS